VTVILTFPVKVLMRSETDVLGTDAVLGAVCWQWYSAQEKLKCTSDGFGELKYRKACLEQTLALE
jgi:hypothetical protein